ncbi:MAG: hypothetical protein R2749_19905 [Acidimicrobiales bacterium]
MRGRQRRRPGGRHGDRRRCAAERSGLLAWVAERLATGVRRPRLLLAATFAVAVVLTTTCNLDTTAVLFTPLALSVAAAAGLDAVPFALASVLAANFARCCCRR